MTIDVSDSKASRPITMPVRSSTELRRVCRIDGKSRFMKGY